MSHTKGPWTYDEHGGNFYVWGLDHEMVADSEDEGGHVDKEVVARMRGTGRGATDEEKKAKRPADRGGAGTFGSVPKTTRGPSDMDYYAALNERYDVREPAEDLGDDEVAEDAALAVPEKEFEPSVEPLDCWTVATPPVLAVRYADGYAPVVKTAVIVGRMMPGIICDHGVHLSIDCFECILEHNIAYWLDRSSL